MKSSISLSPTRSHLLGLDMRSIEGDQGKSPEEITEIQPITTNNKKNHFEDTSAVCSDNNNKYNTKQNFHAEIFTLVFLHVFHSSLVQFGLLVFFGISLLVISFLFAHFIPFAISIKQFELICCIYKCFLFFFFLSHYFFSFYLSPISCRSFSLSFSSI